ncbi:MAG: hypothetical protein IKO61_03220 [Lachnospiraceae bacterium]|nr:hypothetical protein [Lachnospiraceae bacterium]
MFRTDYKNPMTKIYQLECAMTEVMADMFHRVICNSRGLDKLRLYYADLTSGTREKPNCSKQWSMEETMERLIKRDVAANIEFPGMSVCNVALRLHERKDGTHDFIYTDGVYAFAIHLVTEVEKIDDFTEKIRPVRIECRNLELNKAA